MRLSLPFSLYIYIQEGEDSQDRIARQESRNRITRTGQPERDIQNETGRERTGRTVQAEQYRQKNSQSRTART
jgi:hypothetical protein